jgi:hypothetical protein
MENFKYDLKDIKSIKKIKNDDIRQWEIDKYYKNWGDESYRNYITKKYKKESSVKWMSYFFMITLFVGFKIYNSNSENSTGVSSNCTQPDTSGNYMDNVINYVKKQDYMVSGYYFSGNGFYNLNVIKPSVKPGSFDIEVLVNECGDILRVVF